MSNADWIPVNVALPEHEQDVFFARYGHVHRGKFHVHSDRCLKVSHFEDHNMRYWHPSEKVTHWMPSPTPKPPSV